MHEAQLHQLTSFVTLTYNDQHLPARRAVSRTLTSARLAGRPGLPLRLDTHARAETCTHEIQEWTGSLCKGDLQAFTKRLNECTRRKFGKGIKYYACGEYGEKTERPHYHIAIYGEDFSDDRIYWKQSNGNRLYRSSRLATLWPHGDADIGELTFESAAYIARYIMKKVTGVKAPDHYTRKDKEGNTYHLVPEFNVMSRGGRNGRGIAADWFMKNKNDVYPHDHVISRGHPAKPPRYYDKLLEALAPYEHALIKEQREKALQTAERLTPAQLESRETVTIAKLKQKKRSLE